MVPVLEKGFATIALGTVIHIVRGIHNPDLIDQELDTGGDMAVVESVKAASDVYAPISGTVTAVNDELGDDPEKINADPYGDGWIVRLQPSEDIDEAALLSPDDYQNLLDEEDA